MKQFDSASIATRLTNTLINTSTWSQIIGDSATVNLINAISESNAEIVRYCENLLSESKWNVAQNLSSYTTQCPYIGYVPRKKVSALGNVYFSHDPQLTYLGGTLFSLTELQSKLTTYSGSDIVIPLGTRVSTQAGTNFITTQSATYTKGIQYLEVPIMQGNISSLTVGILGNPFEEIVITDPLIEDASNSASSQFLIVTLKLPNTVESKVMTRYEDIFLADATTYAYEVSVSTDLTSTIIKFGDGITGALLPNGSTITIAYVQSLGSLGNVNSSYTINQCSTAFTPTLYCSNLDAALGGADQDTVNSIQGKAPDAYLTSGGSIVSTNSYGATIESLPYIQTSIVYADMYYDPITQLTQNTLMYSAITTAGGDASEIDDVGTFTSITIPTLMENKNSPLDSLVYISPSFLHVRYNVKGTVKSSSTINIPILTGTTIPNDIYSIYGTTQQKFNTTYDNTAITNYIVEKYAIKKVETQFEAVKNLLPSTFNRDISIPGNFKQTFYFDPAFTAFYGFDSNHQYCLKVNIIFTCAECLDNSRTIFLVPTSSNTTNYNCSLVSTLVSGNIVFQGYTIPVTFDAGLIADPNTSAIMNTIYTAIITATINGTPGYFSDSNPNKPFTIKWSPSGTMSVTPVTGGTSSSSGMLQIPTVGGIGGVSFNSSTGTSYTTKQYAYWNIGSSITDNKFMIEQVLPVNGSIPEITSTTTTTVKELYIPIIIDFDYGSLNPTDLANVKLGYGTISIPSFLPNSTTQNYLNFDAGASVDDNVIIEVVAQPISQIVDPYTKNSIVQLGKITQNTSVNIHDAVIQLTSE